MSAITAAATAAKSTIDTPAKGDKQMEQNAVDTAQLEARIAQLTEELRIAHDAVASCEYQLDTRRTFTSKTATEEERVWLGKARYALKKNKQKLNDLPLQISKLNATLKEERHKAMMAKNYASRKVKYLAFYRNAKKNLPPDVFKMILDETIQQVDAL